MGRLAAGAPKPCAAAQGGPRTALLLAPEVGRSEVLCLLLHHPDTRLEVEGQAGRNSLLKPTSWASPTCRLPGVPGAARATARRTRTTAGRSRTRGPGTRWRPLSPLLSSTTPHLSATTTWMPTEVLIILVLLIILIIFPYFQGDLYTSQHTNSQPRFINILDVWSALCPSRLFAVCGSSGPGFFDRISKLHDRVVGEKSLRKGGG